MGQRFLTHLARRAAERLREGSDEIVERIRAETQQSFDARVSPGADRPTRMVLAACCMTLAAFRKLVVHTGSREIAFEIVRDAFQRTYQLPVRLVTRAVLAWSPDPVQSLPRLRLKQRGQMLLGVGMEFEEAVTQDAFELSVTRCAFHQFFVENGEPSLTAIVCEWDRNWMDAVDSSKRPVHIERPSTISTGGDRCRFRFVRAEPENRVPSDVVLERLPRRAAPRTRR